MPVGSRWGLELKLRVVNLGLPACFKFGVAPSRSLPVRVKHYVRGGCLPVGGRWGLELKLRVVNLRLPA